MQDIERVSELRKSVNRTSGVRDHRVSKGDIDLIGAVAEAAVATWLNKYDEWSQNAVQRTPQSQKHDIGFCHVRGTTPGRGLLIKPNDVDGAYVCVWVRESIGIIKGWRFKFECLGFFRRDISKPAYICPARLLYDLKSLRSWHAYKEGR